jgi:UPF0716 family protein affecting phage T7 exclusion
VSDATVNWTVVAALIAIPGLMMLCIGLIVIWLVERRATRRCLKAAISAAAERKYIRKCFPAKPSGVPGRTEAGGKPDKGSRVTPLKAPGRLERAEWGVEPREILDPRADWN